MEYNELIKVGEDVAKFYIEKTISMVYAAFKTKMRNGETTADIAYGLKVIEDYSTIKYCIDVYIEDDYDIVLISSIPIFVEDLDVVNGLAHKIAATINEGVENSLKDEIIPKDKAILEEVSQTDTKEEAPKEAQKYMTFEDNSGVKH